MPLTLKKQTLWQTNVYEVMTNENKFMIRAQNTWISNTVFSVLRYLCNLALAGVAQGTEHPPAKQRVPT